MKDNSDYIEQEALKLGISIRTIKSSQEFVQGLDKMSSELRRDILECRIKVKKMTIRKIGRDASIIKVQTIEELEGLS